MKIIKQMYQKSQISFIMSIISFLIGCFFIHSTIGYPLKVSFTISLIGILPFLIFFLVVIGKYFLSNKKIINIILTIISGFLTFFLVIYYFIAIFICAIIQCDNPITNYKNYEHFIKSDYLLKAFPVEIPDTATNISFYHRVGILQGGTNYSLYYIDKTISFEEFDKKYNEIAIWSGRINEYNENFGLLSGAFSNTPVEYKNEEEFIIYLIDGECDDSGFCNHGDFLLAAYNIKTHEIVYSSDNW